MVSVVLSTYNVENYIKETIESILNQTYSSVEVIIVDDGSLDNTIKIIESFDDNRIRLIKKEHTGNIGRNLNEGIKLSNYDIICINGADDLWVSNKIEFQLKYLAEYKCVCSNAFIIDNKSKINAYRNYSSRVENSELELAELLISNEVIASSVMCYKSVIKECGYFDEKVGNRAEDYYLWCNIVSKHKIFYLKEPLVKYRMHEKNLSTKSYSDMEELSYRAIDIRKSFLLMADKKIIKAAKKGILIEYSRLLNSNLKNNNLKKAYIHSKLAMNYMDGNAIKFCKYYIFQIYCKLRLIFSIGR